MDTKTKFALSAAILVAVILSSYSEDISSTITNSNNGNNNTSNNNNNNENTIAKFLRIGYFPNLNLVQAVTGLQGDFQRLLGNNNIRIESRNLEVTYDPVQKSLFEQANNAYDQGFLAGVQSSKPDLSGIYDLSILNQVLKEKDNT